VNTHSCGYDIYNNIQLALVLHKKIFDQNANLKQEMCRRKKQSEQCFGNLNYYSIN